MIDAKPLERITKKEFQAYERVRRSGQFNMFDPRAREASGLTESAYLGVIKYYRELMEKFPHVRKAEGPSWGRRR